MNHSQPQVLEALRLPELLRCACRHAGLGATSSDSDERFVLRSGAEPAGLFAALLEEAAVEDESEVQLWPASEPPDYRALVPGQFAVRPGFGSPCPAAQELRRAAQPRDGAGEVLLFAVERRDQEGRLLGLMWAAMPEEEPDPQAVLRAAVLRVDAAGRPAGCVPDQGSGKGTGRADAGGERLPRPMSSSAPRRGRKDSSADLRWGHPCEKMPSRV